MNKIVVMILLLAVVLAAPALADFRVGIKGGTHLGNASITNPDVTTDMRAGTIHGPYVEWMPETSRMFAARIEALWTDKGWSQDVTIAGQNYTNSVSIKELGVAPFLLVYFGDVQYGTAPFLQVGPEIGFNMSTLSRIDTDPAQLSEFSYWNSINFGLNFGGGVSFRAGLGKLVLDARYNLGLAQLNDAPAPSTTEVVTNGIQIQVGYDFSVFPRYRRSEGDMMR